MDKAQLAGTVSHGTMRTEDLIPAFLNVLADYDMEEHDRIRDDYHHHIWEDDADTEGFDYDSEDAQYMLEALFNALNDIAPEGMYFGSHPDDGSDYGFWESEDY